MSAAPSDKPADQPTTAPVPPPPAPQAAPSRPPRDPLSRAFLAVSAVLFFGWLAWLSYAALTKSREPTVSHSQAALADVPVVATVGADEKGAPVMKVTVKESLKPDGPPKDTALIVANLPTATGFTGAGEYLLLLAPDPLGLRGDGPVFQLVAGRPSASDAEPAPIYRWGKDVEAQARRIYREKAK
jgi:hypothetical protein